jgi:predicted DNA-binding protein (MmcQ/YjbR family)
MTPVEMIPRLRKHCMAKVGAFEDNPWGHVAWKVGKAPPNGKLFVIASDDSLYVTVKATIDEQSALIQHPQISVASHVGRHGWVTVEVDSEDTYELLTELIDRSYELVAPKPRRSG